MSGDHGFGVFLFWFLLTFGVLLAVSWLVGWHLGAPRTLDGPVAGFVPQRVPTRAVQFVAAAFGMAGAWLLATQADAGLGFAAFLVSNLGWLAFSAAHRHRWLFIQQVFFLGSSLVGLWNAWLGPWLLG